MKNGLHVVVAGRFGITFYTFNCALWDVAFAHYELVAREVYLEEVRYADVVAYITMAMYRHEPLSVQILE